MKEEKIIALKKVFAEKFYHYINVSPRTDKTSIFKKLIKEFYHNEKKNILLLANTGKMADDLCAIVNDTIINFDDINDGHVPFGRSDRNFIRIGDKSSCAQEHEHNLLSNIRKHLFAKGEIMELFEKHSIFISTIKAIDDEKGFFEMVKTDIIIVDKVSEIAVEKIDNISKKCGIFIFIDHIKETNKIEAHKPESSSLFEKLNTFLQKNI